MTAPVGAPPSPPVAPIVRLRPRPSAFTARISLPSLPGLLGGDAIALGALTLFLVGLGLLMVLSASSVEQGVAGDPFGDFLTQAGATAIGLLGMTIAARRSPAFLMRIAPFAFGAALVLQALALWSPLGHDAGGNRNWLYLGPVSVQPSEFVKLGLILVVASFFSRREAGRQTLQRLVPVLVIGVVAIGLVMLGKDLGTVLILGAVLFAGLLFAGVRLPILVLLGIAAAGLLRLAALANGSRIDRFAAWAAGCGGDVTTTCWQSKQAEWALANGGVFGVGVGNSVSKWFWLPEADNDFILAVVGEETGLVGLLVLIGCFVAIAVVLLRIGSRGDAFTRTFAGMTLVWLVGQAFANIAVVLGVLPVFGVPLPFVSAGGSSMVANLLAVGCVIGLARPRTAAAS